MAENENARRFRDLILPHLDAGYNLARWIVKNDAGAEDIVQESCVKALKGMARFRGENPRGWLLAIVRHESYDWLSSNKGARMEVNIDDESGLSPSDMQALSHDETPELKTMHLQDKTRIEKALLDMPAAYREVLVLKELEDMSYKEIAAVTGAPIGTVMSRLARGRAVLKTKLVAGDET